MAVGVALSINAHMGISPISCLPYVLSQINDVMTVGQFTAAMHVFFVLLQIVLLRKGFAPYQLLQLLLGVVLGLMIDFALSVLAFLQPSNYLEQLFLLIISNLMVGFGMYLEVKAGVLMVAGEGLVKALVITSYSIHYTKLYDWLAEAAGCSSLLTRILPRVPEGEICCGCEVVCVIV